MLAVVWLMGFGMLFLPLFGVWGSISKLELGNAQFCDIKDDENGGNPKEFFFVFAFFFPCASIIVCYCAIFYKMKKAHEELTNYFEFLRSSERDEEFREIKTMLIIFLCFLITFMPLGLLNVVDPEVEKYDLHAFFHILWWCSPVINPFIYVYKNKHYMRAIYLLKYRILGILFCKTKPSNVEINSFSLQRQRAHSAPIISRLPEFNSFSLPRQRVNSGPTVASAQEITHESSRRISCSF